MNSIIIIIIIIIIRHSPDYSANMLSVLPRLPAAAGRLRLPPPHRPLRLAGGEPYHLEE